MYTTFSRVSKRIVIICLVVLMSYSVIGIPASVQAAELSPTRKVAFDKIANKAEPTLRTSLVSAYSQVLDLQKQQLDWEAKIKAVYYRNQEELSKVKQRIKGINERKLQQLESKLAKTQASYEPLFAIYRTMDKKSTKLSSTKIAVELARQDIRSQQEQIKAAKADRTAKTKQIRAILAQADPIRSRIKAEKSKITKVNKQKTTKWTSLNTEIKKEQPKQMNSSLSALVNYSSQIIQHLKTTHAYEIEISKLIEKANSSIND